MKKRDVEDMEELRLRLVSKREFLLERIAECKEEINACDDPRWREFVTSQLEEFLVALGALKQLVIQMEEAMLTLNRTSEDAITLLKNIEKFETNILTKRVEYEEPSKIRMYKKRIA